MLHRILLVRSVNINDKISGGINLIVPLTDNTGFSCRTILNGMLTFLDVRNVTPVTVMKSDDVFKLKHMLFTIFAECLRFDADFIKHIGIKFN